MKTVKSFQSTIAEGYKTEGERIVLGAGIFEKKPQKSLFVTLPLKTVNRHGLISGATGTGKTKTLQYLTEQLSDKSVPVLIMDMKGDVSGIAMPGATDARIQGRTDAIGVPWKPQSYPVEFLSISHEPGVRLRATISEFGPVLLSKILELNETQQSIMSLIFKYADDNALPLLDIKDLKKLVQYLTGPGKAEIASEYGTLSTSSTGIILRKLVEIEEQGADLFFGEKSFDAEDLVRVDENGRGYINILRLMDIQDKPKMFSTFMLALLAEVFQKFPEEGDVERPKLVIIIDEAHLIFKEASRELLSQLETVIKLIRSKGVGILFCTQSPTDIPQSILAQLGMKIQFALRAFTALDRKAIHLVAQNYPETEFYEVEKIITELGIGEALITVLSEKGIPTPLVHTLMAPPQSRMDTLTPMELSSVVSGSSLQAKYSAVIDNESAYELLIQKLAKATVNTESTTVSRESTVSTNTLENVFGSSFGKSIIRSMTTSVVRNVTGQITRGILGAIMGKKR